MLRVRGEVHASKQQGPGVRRNRDGRPRRSALGQSKTLAASKERVGQRRSSVKRSSAARLHLE